MNFQKLQYVAFGILVLVSGVALADQDGMQISMKEGIGSYLADGDGMSLYWFTTDSPGKSACTGPCLEKWPVFFREIMTPPAGVEATDLGIITREDGKKQTTFRGYPLHYCAADIKAGDTAGQGVDADWFVINPAAFAALAALKDDDVHSAETAEFDSGKPRHIPDRDEVNGKITKGGE